jgi:pyrroline-5-carboxylate reductase
MLISLAAMVPTAAMGAALGQEIPIIRVIPNVPSLVGCGMNPYCLGDHAGEVQTRLAESLLDLLGSRIRVDEQQMAAATALTGMGPTYVFPLIQALAEAGQDSGLEDFTALRCATETVLGTAAMVLETGRRPDDLRQLVPATTVDEAAVQEMFGGTVRRICQGLREKESAIAAQVAAVPVG